MTSIKLLRLITILFCVVLSESKGTAMQEVDEILNKHHITLGTFTHPIEGLNSEEGDYVRQRQESSDNFDIVAIAGLYAQQAYGGKRNSPYKRTDLLLEAARWYKKAANQGALEAIGPLAGCLNRILNDPSDLKPKIGEEENLRSAIVDLFDLAGRNGDEDAQLAHQALAELYSRL